MSDPRNADDASPGTARVAERLVAERLVADAGDMSLAWPAPALGQTVRRTVFNPDG